MSDQLIGLGFYSGKKQVNELELSDTDCFSLYSDNQFTLKPSNRATLVPSQNSYYSTSDSDNILTRMALLREEQHIYKNSENFNIIKTHISLLIFKKRDYLQNPNINFQEKLEGICNQMLVSEFEFICFCTYFDYFAGKLSSISIEDFAMTAFFVIKSKTESDYKLLEVIENSIVNCNRIFREKIEIFQGFEIDLYRANNVLDYYKKNRHTKINYSNYVGDILRTSNPYNCAVKSTEGRKKRMHTSPETMKSSSETSSINRSRIKLDFKCISPIDLSQMFSGDKHRESDVFMKNMIFDIID